MYDSHLLPKKQCVWYVLCVIYLFVLLLFSFYFCFRFVVVFVLMLFSFSLWHNFYIKPTILMVSNLPYRVVDPSTLSISANVSTVVKKRLIMLRFVEETYYQEKRLSRISPFFSNKYLKSCIGQSVNTLFLA